jgi:hypothetical protein
MSAHDIEEIELSIEHSKKLIARKQSLQKLIKNRDFKAIITEGYFEQEAQRLVLMKAEPSMQNEEAQKEILRQIDAIGSLRQYFMMINALGNNAEKALEDHEETLSELMAEGIDA